MSVRLVWNQQQLNERVTTAQKMIDSECLRLMKPYTPFKTGVMEKSATLGTVIGSGKIVYNSPYARYQYYGVVYGPNIPIHENGQLVGFYSPPHKHRTDRMLQYSTARHPKAQRLWFEVMKQKHLPQLLKKVAREAGGRAE